MNFFTLWWVFALIIIGSYLIGSLNNAIMISKLAGKDVRKMGSGNPGTMNISRSMGLKAGILTLLLDVLKGVIPTLIASFLFKDRVFDNSILPVPVLAKYMAGFFVVFGHIFPIFYGFKGGKGIATTIGVFFVCNWYISLIFGAVALAFILITRIGSMGSFLATTPPAIFSVIELYNEYYLAEPNFEYKLAYFIFTDAFIIGIIALTWIAHRKNIQRLLSGDEHPTDWLQMFKDRKLKKAAKEDETAAAETGQSLTSDEKEDVVSAEVFSEEKEDAELQDED